MYKVLSLKEIEKKIRQQHKVKSKINNEKTEEYYEDYVSKINEKPLTELKKKICYLLELNISKEYVADLFKMNIKEIENIAIENKLNSLLFMKYEEKIDNRCFTKRQILKSCEFYNFICPLCFKPLDIRTEIVTGHHILPYSQNGKTEIDNCLPLHIECHYLDFEKLHGLQDSNNRIYTKQRLDEIKELFKTDNSGINCLLNN
jgi:hypothetical protein